MSSQAVPDIAGFSELRPEPREPGRTLLPPGVGRLDCALEQQVEVERVMDRQLGRTLRGLKVGGRYQRLGFVKWADYVVERVGIELRWAQELERLDRACEKVPELGEALASGELVKSKVLELFRVVDEGTPVDERRRWIERAGGMTVRELRREIAATRTTSAPPVADPEETEPGSWVQIRVPMRVASLWHLAVERVRRLSNSEMPLYRCLEHIVADRFSGIGWPEDVSPPPDPAPTAESPPPPPLRVKHRTMSAPSSDVTADPWELDGAIQTIAELKKKARQRLGELLEAMAAAQGWRPLGFTSLEHYAEERLGLHPRTVRRLIRFHRALAKYPELARGYFAGELSYLKVLVLLRVAGTGTAVWTAWAAKRSYLDTQRAVAYAEPYAHSRTMSALPPAGFGAQPRIVGIHSDEPESLPARIRFWCPADLLPFIRAGLRSCRDPAGGLPPPDWRCLEILLVGFLEQAQDPALEQLIARYPELERDGWRCTVPTCSQRAHLHSHHVEHRG